MRNETKKTAIPKKVKDAVWKRDGGCCVWCGSPYASPCAHYISRAQGGLGIEENILTLCGSCHRNYDQGTNRPSMRIYFRQYLKSFYPDWDEKNLVYRKENNDA